MHLVFQDIFSQRHEAEPSEQNAIEAVIDKAFPLGACGDAVAEQRGGHAAGKIVVVMTPEAEARAREDGVRVVGAGDSGSGSIHSEEGAATAIARAAHGRADAM